MKRLFLMGFDRVLDKSGDVKGEGEFVHKDFKEIITLEVNESGKGDFRFMLKQPSEFNLKLRTGLSDNQMIAATYTDILFPDFYERGLDTYKLEDGLLLISASEKADREIFIDLETKEYGASETLNPTALIDTLFAAVNHPYLEEFVDFIGSTPGFKDGYSETEIDIRGLANANN